LIGSCCVTYVFVFIYVYSHTVLCSIFRQCLDTLGSATGMPSSLANKLGVGLLVMIVLELCTPYNTSCHLNIHHP